CIAIINPADSIPSYAFDKLDDYISKGGNVAVAYNNVTGDFQSMQGGVLNTGISNWLLTKGVAVNKDFVLDASAASVTV
ncbi:MAG: hypothetical protein P8M34_01065, partial [Saprospiraceae bacterium]|nr:hypothetical protein [Saprospiraceae bacterium]